jgi:hypothetical protein
MRHRNRQNRTHPDADSARALPTVIGEIESEALSIGPAQLSKYELV